MELINQGRTCPNYGRDEDQRTNFLWRLKCNDPNEDTNPNGPRERNDPRARALIISGFHCRIVLKFEGPLQKTPAQLWTNESLDANESATLVAIKGCWLPAEKMSRKKISYGITHFWWVTGPKKVELPKIVALSNLCKNWLSNHIISESILQPISMGTIFWLKQSCIWISLNLQPDEMFWSLTL